MKSVQALLGLLIPLLLAGTALGDSSPGGGGGMSGSSMPAPVQRSPEERAFDYYKQGVKHKERAWRHEERALAEDRKDRYATAAELAVDIEKAGGLS